MIRKFKCIACGKKFDADDKDTIVCPKCHSDNVKPVKPDYLRPIGLALVLLVSVGVGMFVTRQCKGIGQELTEEEKTFDIGDSIHKDTLAQYDIDPELLKIVEIQNTAPVYDKKSKSYSLNVSVKNVPNGANVEYELCENYDSMNHVKQIIKTSDDGFFETIPVSRNESKSYFVVITVTGSKGNVLASRYREIGGFDPVIPVSKGLTKEDIQKMINQRDGALQGGDVRISNNVKIVVQNPTAGDKVQTFQNVFNFLKTGWWESVSVVSVHLDSDNHVTQVVLSVKHGDVE